MQPPDELMMEVFLPSIRQLIAKALRAQGLSQNRISVMLGVTQASVSLYLSSGPDKAYTALSSLSLRREEADSYVALLAEGVRRSPVYGVETLGSIWKSMLGRGLLCEAHRKLYPSLSQCDVCIKDYGGETGRSEAIAQVSEAVRLLESSSTFVSVMPEVSVNIAFAPPEADSPDDVVAVPGRIVKVKGGVRASLPPEFGASRHLARMLLLVKGSRPELRACINIRYDRAMNRLLRSMKLRLLELGEYNQPDSGDPTVAALSLRLRAGDHRFDVVVDPGGKGVEPNLYLFAPSPIEVARRAVKMAERYSAR